MTEIPSFKPHELVAKITSLDIQPRIPVSSLQWVPQIGQETQVACFFPGGSVGLEHPLLQELSRLASSSASCLLAQFPNHEDLQLNVDARKRFLLGQARALAIAQGAIDYARGKPALLGGKSIGGVHALTAAARLSESGILVPHVYMFGVPTGPLNDVMRPALEIYGRRGGIVHGFQATDDTYGAPVDVEVFLKSINPRFTLDTITGGGHGLGYGDPGHNPVSQSAIDQFKSAFTARLQQ